MAKGKNPSARSTAYIATAMAENQLEAPVGTLTCPQTTAFLETESILKRSDISSGIAAKISAYQKTCQHVGCSVRPSFGVEGSQNRESCARHALTGMVRIVQKICSHFGCSLTASHGPKREICVKHAHETGEVGMTPKKECIYLHCGREATFGIVGSRSRQVCAAHKTEGMATVGTKMCAHENGCLKRPSYGKVGSGIPEYCAEHAYDGMVNVVSKRCAHQGCSKIPAFGAKGSAKREFCKTHAAEGMVTVGRRMCTQADCYKFPTYGVEGGTRRILCAQHAQSGMVDFTRKCPIPGCFNHATFANLGSSRKRKLCAEHAEDGMAHTPDKKCAQPGCRKNAMLTKNYGGTARSYCPEHASQQEDEGGLAIARNAAIPSPAAQVSPGIKNTEGFRQSFSSTKYFSPQPAETSNGATTEEKRCQGGTGSRTHVELQPAELCIPNDIVEFRENQSPVASNGSNGDTAKLPQERTSKAAPAQPQLDNLVVPINLVVPLQTIPRQGKLQVEKGLTASKRIVTTPLLSRFNSQDFSASTRITPTSAPHQIHPLNDFPNSSTPSHCVTTVSHPTSQRDVSSSTTPTMISMLCRTDEADDYASKKSTLASPPRKIVRRDDSASKRPTRTSTPRHTTPFGGSLSTRSALASRPRPTHLEKFELSKEPRRTSVTNVNLRDIGWTRLSWPLLQTAAGWMEWDWVSARQTLSLTETYH